MRTDTRPLDTQTGRSLDMIADMSAAQWDTLAERWARYAQVFDALDQRTRDRMPDHAQRTLQRMSDEYDARELADTQPLPFDRQPEPAADTKPEPQRTGRGRGKSRRGVVSYRKNMRAADILQAHFADGRNAGDLYIPARQLADKLGIGSTTANDYQVRMRGYLDDGGEA